VQDGPLDAAARPDRRYVWGVDGELLLADVNGSGAVKLVADGVLNFRFYPLADLEGNVVALVRGEKLDGRMEWNGRQRCAYTPLGELALLEGDYQAASTPLMGWDLFFGGLSREAATGLDYSHNGFYHPNLGLVLNGGGIGHVDEAELYAYVQPTPTDASGVKRRVLTGDQISAAAIDGTLTERVKRLFPGYRSRQHSLPQPRVKSYPT